MRTTIIKRKTNETDIIIEINLDGEGKSEISTQIGFFDHMLTAFAKHSGIDLKILVKGDLFVDCHHTIEDTGIALGIAIAKCLSDKSKIARYGSCLIPMDESLALSSLDISGRPFFVFDCQFSNEKIGEMDTQMIAEFFRAVTFNSMMTLHLKLLYGLNDHHKCEALFKAFGHAFKNAINQNNDSILSTKGVL